MKNTTLLLVLVIIFSSCSHSILRTGYEINKTDYKRCEIVIKKNMQSTDTLRKVGEIKLNDSGFSVDCSEEDAIEILKNEGCALNANIINIIEENRPDILSSCYRCKAEFYKTKTQGLKIQNDEIYNANNINNRVSEDRNRNTVMAVISVVVGITIGYLLVQ